MTDIPPRDIIRLEQAITSLTKTIDSFRIEMASTYVRQDVYERDLDNIKDDVEKHDEWLTWALRIVVGLVITALVGIITIQNGGM